MLKKIVSGGQTGVDRGALDAALEASFPCGGWCPKGRKAEDGAIPARYPLTEMPGPTYRARTRRNVTDSDGTLNLFFGIFNLFPLLPMDGGHIAIAWFERLRSWLAAKRGKPDPGRVDYVKLAPITLGVIGLGMAGPTIIAPMIRIGVSR